MQNNQWKLMAKVWYLVFKQKSCIFSGAPTIRTIKENTHFFCWLSCIHISEVLLPLCAGMSVPLMRGLLRVSTVGRKTIFCQVLFDPTANLARSPSSGLQKWRATALLLSGMMAQPGILRTGSQVGLFHCHWTSNDIWVTLSDPKQFLVIQTNPKRNLRGVGRQQLLV